MKCILTISMVKKEIEGITIDPLDYEVEVEIPDDMAISQANDKVINIFDQHADVYLESNE